MVNIGHSLSGHLYRKQLGMITRAEGEKLLGMILPVGWESPSPLCWTKKRESRVRYPFVRRVCLLLQGPIMQMGPNSAMAKSCVRRY